MLIASVANQEDQHTFVRVEKSLRDVTTVTESDLIKLISDILIVKHGKRSSFLDVAELLGGVLPSILIVMICR